MKKENRILLSTGCLAALLAIGAIGTANAAIVPFNGTGYSWLHERPVIGGPWGDWITEIKDTVYVRTGDTVQFTNRWYNGYAGAADIRISYGGLVRYTCAGADEYVLYGLNYGNYFPSGTGSWSAYSTILNCSEERYPLSVNHQYVYNGIMYGSGPSWSLGFSKGTPGNSTANDAPDTNPQDEIYATVMPSIIPTAMPIVSDAPSPSPSPGFGTLLTTGCMLTAVLITLSHHKKRQN